jgi:thioredoxin reductase
MRYDHDYVILGGGPGGIQLGYFLERAERDYVILERSERAGAFFETFPRHRQLISINKRFTGSSDPEFNLRHDWNSLLGDENAPRFGDYDERYFPQADNLVRYLNDFVAANGLRIATGTAIARIERSEDGYRLLSAGGDDYCCRCLVVATGMSQPFVPAIPGIELAERYFDLTRDRSVFAGKRVLIIGKGNSAFETADDLVGEAALIHLASPESIEMAWKTHYVGHLRAINNSILDTYHLKSQNAILDASILGLRRDGDKLVVKFHYSHAEDEEEEIEYDRVILCAGFRFDPAPFDDSARPELTPCGRYPAIGWDYESIDRPNMYFVGTITHSLDYRKATSGFIHGFRYNSRALARVLAAKRHGEPWPATRREAEPGALTQAIIDRVNRSSALWQQPGYMTDILGLTGECLLHYCEMPMGYARAFGDERFAAYLVVSLEYGDAAIDDPFRIERSFDASRSVFLHPVVRLYVDGECRGTCHLLEDLEADWTKPVHRRALLEFVENALAHGGSDRPTLLAESSTVA